jgi:hypothetical protein
MTEHRQRFFDAAATPNLLLRYQQKLTPLTLESIKERWQARYGGPAGTGATVVLDEGADLTIVGASFESMRFNEVQNAGEARICAAARVPAIVAGVQAGLDASTFANYKASYRSFVNGAATFLWLSLAASLSKLVNVPADSELILDPSGMPALRDDEQDRANAMQTTLAAASTGLTAGYEPDSIAAYLGTGDLSKLKHTGLVSVQLYKAAAKEDATIPALPIAPPPGGPVPARHEHFDHECRECNPSPVSRSLTVNPAEVRVLNEIHNADITVNVPEQAPPTIITRNVGDFPAPIVNVTVEPTPITINVEPTPVTVNVPEQSITVTPAPVENLVHVEMPPRTSKTKVTRDKSGLITSTETTES